MKIKTIDLWAIAAVVALILAIVSAWCGFAWASAICGFIAGTYAGALSIFAD
jgi:hypothetical protein